MYKELFPHRALSIFSLWIVTCLLLATHASAQECRYNIEFVKLRGKDLTASAIAIGEGRLPKALIYAKRKDGDHYFTYVKGKFKATTNLNLLHRVRPESAGMIVNSMGDWLDLNGSVATLNKDGNVTELRAPSGSWFYPSDLNDSGQVVGMSLEGPLLYDQGTYRNLNVEICNLHKLPDQAVIAYLYSLNNLGYIAGDIILKNGQRQAIILKPKN